MPIEEKNRFVGAPYPVVKTPRGLLAPNRGVDQIKSDLLILLLTNPKERVMLPNFGTPLRKLIFEPNDSFLATEAREMIIRSIERWEPRINVTDISVTNFPEVEDLHPEDTRDDIEHILLISIKFTDFNNIGEVQELVLKLPLASGVIAS